MKDLLLLQSVIRTPANTDVDILVRQATAGTMRETLKEIDKRGFANIFVHLSTQDTYRLLRAVSAASSIRCRRRELTRTLTCEQYGLYTAFQQIPARKEQKPTIQ